MKEPIDKLIQKAREGEDASIRREALIELGYHKDASVFPVLREQLRDDNSSIQHAAVISLNRYGNSEAIEALTKPRILNSPVVNIRWAAVSAIGALGDIKIIDHLLRVMDDSEWIVRNQAATEIKEKIKDIIQLNECRYARILIRLLPLQNEEIVNLAIEGLVGLGETVADYLLDALKSPSIPIRKYAAKTLGLIGSTKAVFPLIALLKDSEWDVRVSVVEALGQIGREEAVEPLVLALSDNVERVQRQAVQSVALLGRLSTESLLNALYREKNKFALRAIIQSLGEIGDKKAIPALLDNLRNSYFIVRRAAMKALIHYGPDIVDPLIPCLSYNESDIDVLLKDAESSENPQLQLRAVKALGGLEDHRARDILKQLVDDGSPEVQDEAAMSLIQIGCAAWGRVGALIVLSEIGDESIIPNLEHSLNDDSENVRLETVRTLARVGSERAVDLLVTVAKTDCAPYIRYEAVLSLRRIGVGYKQVLEMALSGLKDENRDVRSQAARLLGNFQDDRSIRPLIKSLADPHWSVRESAEIALLNFGKKSVSYLIEALSNKSWTVRCRAARLLGDGGDSKAVKSLEKVLKKEDEHEEVIRVAQESLNNLKAKLNRSNG